MGLKKCVLCFSKCSSDKRCSEATIISEENIIHKPADGDGDDPVKNHLEIIFLLRKILEIPQDKFNFLGDDGDFYSWINCCASCLGLVEKGKIIFDQIVMLQNQFENLQNEIKRTISSSVFEENGCDTYKWGDQEGIRSLITQGSDKSKINFREEEEEQQFSNSDLNASSEQFSSFPLPSSSSNSDFIFNQWSDVEESSSDTFYDADKCNSREQDPIEIDEADTIPHFINVVDIKTEIQTQSCYLIEDEQTVSQEEEQGLLSVFSISYNCKICEESFGDIISLTTHEKSHTVGGIVFKCDICGEGFQCRDLFQNHTNAHAWENVRKFYKCAGCEKCFFSQAQRKKHERIHTGEKPFNCQFCEKVFRSANHARRHERIHTADKPYKCQFCEKVFRNSSHAREHERIHTGEKPYKCRFCGKDFTASSSLKVHLKTHSGEKPFNCGVCGTSFVVLSKLIEHEKVHTPKDPSYKCSVCGESFSKLSLLKCHEKSHNVEKSYECSSCGLSFSKSSALKYHEKSHIIRDILQPFKCDICGVNISGPRALDSHVLKVHGFWR